MTESSSTPRRRKSRAKPGLSNSFPMRFPTGGGRGSVEEMQANAEKCGRSFVDEVRFRCREYGKREKATP